MNKSNREKYVKNWRKSHHVVWLDKDACSKYSAAEQLPLPRFVERCIELYLTDETFKLMVHGCSTKGE